jgi:hypothetical protein
LGLALAVPAAAQEPAQQKDPAKAAAASKVAELNAAAQSSFKSYSYRGARRKLEEALQVANDAGLSKEPALVQTYLLMGVTSIAGFNDLYRGLHFFVKAIRIDPKAHVPVELATPQLVQMFGRAKKAIRVIGAPPTIDLGTAPPIKVTDTGKTTRTSRLGLVHEPVDQAKRGFPIPIKAQAGIDVQAHKMYLYYRPAGRVKFDRQQMKLDKGVFRGQIPPSASMGRYIHYYIEAVDQRGRVSARYGSAKSPNVVIFK